MLCYWNVSSMFLLGMFLLSGKTKAHVLRERKPSHSQLVRHSTGAEPTMVSCSRYHWTAGSPEENAQPYSKGRSRPGVGREDSTSDHVTRETGSPPWGTLQEAPSLDKQSLLRCFSLLVQHWWTEENRTLSRNVWHPAKQRCLPDPGINSWGGNRNITACSGIFWAQN